MGITFKIGESSRLVFGDVMDNQFFIDDEGGLCQKYDATRYNVLSDENGVPYCNRIDVVGHGGPIRKIVQ